jgi:hypothetical protein
MNFDVKSLATNKYRHFAGLIKKISFRTLDEKKMLALLFGGK